MLNLTNMVRAPSYQFRVEMERKLGMNATENARKRMVYVRASSADDAKKEAKRQHPEFFAQSARKV